MSGNRFGDIKDWRAFVADRLDRSLEVLPDIREAQAEGLCDAIVRGSLQAAGRGLGGMQVVFDLHMAPIEAWRLVIEKLNGRGFDISEGDYLLGDFGELGGFRLFWVKEEDNE